MVIEITRREVLNNLIRFKDNLLEMHAKEKAEVKKGGRVYKVLLNRRTGDMRFAQKISSLEQHFPRKAKGSPEDWKEIHILVQQKSDRDPVHFEVVDAYDKELSQVDMEPLAWRIARETLDVLNIKGKEVRAVPLEMLPEEAALLDLSSIHLSTQQGRIDDLPGWKGPISRLQAESRLRGKSLGSYLLRDGDPVTRSTAVQLSLSNRQSIRAYALTMVEREKKISEYLLLHTDKGWMVYNDEPRLLSYRFYHSPQELLQALNAIARHPIT